MDNSTIDFDELEHYEWKTYDESLRSLSGRVSSHLLAEAVSAVNDRQPFLDYNSFLSYVASCRVDTIPNKELVRLERLGFGATRTVYRGTCPSHWNDKQVAIKRLNLEIPQTKSDIRANTEELYQQLAEASLELRVLSNSLLRFHPNIVDLLAVSWEEVQGEHPGNGEIDAPLRSVSIRPLLIVELAYQQHPTLDEYTAFVKSNNETISVDVKVSILSDIADALSAVHACGVVHGDIKPQNVLLFKNQDGSLTAKLSDFGGCFASEEAKLLNARKGDPLNGLAGTEYWNAPEATSREHPSFSLETRDYYSLGLVTYYLLFEDLPFGDDANCSALDLENIARLKHSSPEMLEVVLNKFNSRWRLGASKEALDALSSVELFYDRQEKFQALYKASELVELSHSGSSWTVNRGNDFRHYSFLFVIWQLLQYDSGKRRQGGLMNDLRLFLNDRNIANSLRYVYLMQAWKQFWSSYESEQFDIWHFGTMFEEASKTVLPAREVKIAWKGPPVDITSELSTTFDWYYFERLPLSLKNLFVREVQQQLTTTTGPQKIHYLLTLAFCESLGYVKEEEGKKDFLLQAARLGSTVAKNGVLALSEARQMRVEMELQEKVQWLYDILLARMPIKEQFANRINQLVPNVSLLSRILHKVFESEVLRTRIIRKKAIKADDEAEETRLAFESAQDGDVFRLESLLRQNSKEIMEAVVDGYKLLHVAVEYGHPEIVQMLIRKFGMSISTLTSNGDPPAVIALRAHDLNTLTALLSLGANHESVLGAHSLRCIANYGGPKALRQMLYFISIWSSTEAKRTAFPLQAFLDGGFSVYEERIPDDEPEFPPLFASILGDNLQTLGTLLEMGSSTEVVAEFSSGFLAPIHVAANLRPLHLALLLHYGANPNQRTADKRQWTALQIACVAHSVPVYLFPRATFTNLVDGEERDYGLQPEDYADANLIAVQLLVGYGANFNAQDRVGMTALAYCMSDERSLPIADLLVNHLGADLWIKDFRGLSCMHRAVVNQSSVNVLGFCIENGLDVNETDIHEFTPLMLAAASPKLDLVRTLVEAGASLIARQNKGWHVLNIAIHDGSDEVAIFLLQASKDQGHFKEMVMGKDIYDYSLLHQVCCLEEASFNRFSVHFPAELIQELLSEPDPAGFGGLLHHALLVQSSAAVCFLLRHGADVNMPGWRGLRPLHIAYGAGLESMVLLLKNSGANDALQDASGRIPEDYAVLCAADPTFWTVMKDEYDCERRQLTRAMTAADFDRIEEENRKEAQAKGSL